MSDASSPWVQAAGQAPTGTSSPTSAPGTPWSADLTPSRPVYDGRLGELYAIYLRHLALMLVTLARWSALTALLVFGGHWAARMAAKSQRLRCAVACGAPTHHSFKVKGTIGIPDVIIRALLNVTGARTLPGLGMQLQALSLQGLYRQIRIPLLVINGERDTLLSTQDSVDLAEGAPHATLKLYPDDDHCAMGHYREWLDLSQAWLKEHLTSQQGASHALASPDLT